MANRENRSIKNKRRKLLAQERERRRINRLGRKYDAERYLDHDGRFIRNTKYRVARPEHGTIRISLPEHLTMNTAAEAEALYRVIHRFSSLALEGRHRRIILDQDNVTTLTPEAAILLLAELQRCVTYCAGRTRLSGTYPRDHAVSELLIRLGFFEALKVPPPQLPAAYDQRTYVEVVSGHQSDAKAIDRLLSCFDEALPLSTNDRRNLHIAILECMDNVYEHAYQKSDTTAHLFREWWLVGFADREEGKASFIFYDQGYGIVKTIRTFKTKQLGRQRIPSWSDSSWIKRACNKQISRHDSKRRGHGLQKLKKFIDKAQVDGTMRVIANRGEYLQTTGQPEQTRDYNVPAPGTLVIWSLVAKQRQLGL